MSGETIIIYDLSGNPVFDPEDGPIYATDLVFNSYWPKGFAECSFKIKRGDVFASWGIQPSYGVKVYDGTAIIYQGRIETIPRSLSGLDEYITINCVGWWCLLEERLIHKWWIDIKGVSRLDWPDGLETDLTQNTFINNRRGGTTLQVFLGSGDILRQGGEVYRERCDLPAGTVRQVSFHYVARSGEGFSMGVINPATSATEWNIIATPTPVSGDASVGFTASTSSFEFHWGVKNTDLYDQNDYGHISNLTIMANYETGHPQISNPTYTQGQLIKDIILLINQQGAQLSTDFGQVDEPGYVLNPFALEKPEYAGRVVEKIAGYGDSSLNTWGACVWDDGDTSDGKPRFTFESMDTSDYDYEVEVSSDVLTGLTFEEVSEGLVNDVTVSYVNKRDVTKFRKSTDNAALADAASIAAEYRRGYLIELGQADTTRADYVGARYINYHKDRKVRGSIPVQGYIRRKGGGLEPVNRVRAGSRVRLLNTGDIFFIRSTAYNAETQQVTISPDLPDDNVAMLLVQKERGFGKLA